MKGPLAEGVALFNAGRFEEALARFRAAPAEPEARVFIGHVSLSLGRPADASAAFRSVIADFPRRLSAYSGLANLILRLAPARDRAAERALLRALALKPGDGDFRARLADTLRACGQALRAVGELEAAEKALTKALALGRGGAVRRRLLDVLRARAESHLAAGDPRRAESALRKVLELEPEDARARGALVRLLRRRGLSHVSEGRLGAAETTLRRALALSPRDADARRQRAEVERLRARSEKARLAAARRGKAVQVRALRGRGGALAAAGRLSLAEGALRRALLASPGDAGAGRQLAEVLAMREQAAAARVQAAAAAKGEKLRALLEALKAAGQARRSSARARTAPRLLARLLALDPEGARGRLLAGGILYASGEVARGRALLAQALRFDRGTLLPGERVAAMIKLGRYRAAIAAAEALLDGRPALSDLRALRDPWEWDDRPRGDRTREIARFERALGAAGGPWLPYYRADLRGPGELTQLAKLASWPARRYGWMLEKAGIASLCAGRFPEAERRLRGALAYKAADWRTRGFLAEALLCRGLRDAAFAEMDRALPDAPADEKGQVVAWRGAFDLWLGRYEDALRRFDEALSLGAPYALGWRAAALLKLGRAKEALAALDEALALYPRDLEAYVWRGEAKRALGLHRAALKDLDEPALSDPDRATPIWLWALFNRALAKGALGDRAGLIADYEAIPAPIRDHIRSRTGLEEPARILEAGLELSRGWRREEYKQAIWMSV